MRQARNQFQLISDSSDIFSISFPRGLWFLHKLIGKISQIYIVIIKVILVDVMKKKLQLS